MTGTTVTRGGREERPDGFGVSPAPPVNSVTLEGYVFKPMVRMAVRRRLREKGYGPVEAFRITNELTDDLIDQVRAEVAPEAAAIDGSAVAGGPVVDAILEFFRSDAGKALVEAILKILLGILVV